MTIKHYYTIPEDDYDKLGNLSVLLTAIEDLASNDLISALIKLSIITIREVKENAEFSIEEE